MKKFSNRSPMALLFACAAGALCIAPGIAAAQDLDTVGRWVHDVNKHVWTDGEEKFIPQYAALLRDGRVLMWHRTGGLCSNGHFVERIWDPRTGAFTNVGSDNTDHTSCSGFAPLANGSILSAGGSGKPCARQTTEYSFDDTPWIARARMTLDVDPNFDDLCDDYQTCYNDCYAECTGTTCEEVCYLLCGGNIIQNSIAGRWYPTLTRLPDGRMLATLGLNCPLGDHGLSVLWPEVYTPWDPVSQTGDYWTVYDCTKHPHAKARDYPHMYVLPDGRIFHGGRTSLNTYILDLDGPCTGVSSRWEGPLNGPQQHGDSGSGARTVMYRPGKVMRAGGAHPGVTLGRTLVVDFTGDFSKQEEWVFMNTDATNSQMNFPRYSHHLVVLPTGHVFAVGGRLNSSTYVPQAEWIDPEGIDPGNATVEWEELASIPSQYIDRHHVHPMALLLPDATVMYFGGDAKAGGVDLPHSHLAVIYEPPYLFAGNNPAVRPAIGTAPQTINYGQPFNIRLTQGSSEHFIERVTLVGTGAPTHGFDQNQRFIELEIGNVSTPTQFQATAPETANIAPPGWYMLFVIDDKGVPSKAAWVRLE